MKVIIKSIVYMIVFIIIGICVISYKTYASNSIQSTTWADKKVGKIENIKIIRKPRNKKAGRVENIKITRTKRKITTWVNNIVSEDIVIIKPTWWDHMFLPKWSTVKKVSQEFKSPYVINGSYFWKDKDWDFHPAGTMWTTGASTFIEGLCNDVNLCGMYNLNTLKVSQSIVSGVIEGNFRSSWPLLMREGNIVDKIKNDISHWNRETYRTALVNSPTPYLIYTNKGMTLYSFATIIKRYFPTGSAINLDWWSSTSFYSNSTSFNSSKILPEFLLLR